MQDAQPRQMGQMIQAKDNPALTGKTPPVWRWHSAVHSLQFKASILVVLLVVLVAGGGQYLSLRLAARSLYQYSCNRANEWAESLAGSTSDRIVQGDRESLLSIVRDAIATRGVAYMAIADRDRRILAADEKFPGLLDRVTSEAAQRLTVPATRQPRRTCYPKLSLSLIDVVVPVYAPAQAESRNTASRPIIGYLRLATDISEAERQLAQIADQLQYLAVTVIVLVAPCSLLVMRKVVAPLNELSRTSRAIADGVMDARAKVSSHNEIGELAAVFNEMADRLAETQFEMLKLNAELEERVQQRTHELEELASRDAVTGLYNRRHFSEVINREFAAAERYDADITCLMFDLDHFKETNDKFGHRTGDEVLMVVADCIARELRESDVAARFGGDEFIVLLPQSSASAAANLADRIVRRFNHRVQEEMPGVPTTLSIGVASLRTTRARSAEALIHEADLALYAAKEAGRNRTMAAAGEPATG